MTDGNRDGIDIDALMGDVPEDPYAHLSREELIAEIERKNRDLREKGRYGLKWEMKDEDIEDRLLEVFPRLVHVPELDVDTGVAEDQPTHLLIEGDNLAALNALQATHAGKVDVAVLDVPYFTGSTDFRYNDSFVAKEDAYAHSKWLSFIHRRMVLVKKLLAPAGVLFVHIDDNEFAQLKLLLDGVMGPENGIGRIIWRKQGGGKSDSVGLATNHEFILVYARDIKSATLGRVEATQEHFTKKDAEGRLFRYEPLDRQGLDWQATLDYPIEDADGVAHYPGGDKAKWEARQRGEHGGKDWRWRLSRRELDVRTAEGRIVFVEDRSGDLVPREIVYAPDEPNLLPYPDYYDEVTNRTGTSQMKDIFGDRVFDFPKPTHIVKHLLAVAGADDDAIVLDCFAGTGTAGQAVLELNAADGGTRTAILATNNENGICREVTRERLRRVMEGYVTPKGKAVSGTGGRLRYLTAWPLPSFEASPEDPECIPRDAALAEVSRTGLETLAELVAIRHGAYAGTTVGGVPLLTGPGVRVAVAATGRMAGISAGLDALGKPECGVARHLYVPCRGDELPEAVVELCGRDGVVAHAIPADVLARMRYEKAEA